jgi:aromatic-L-amino-acid decarboxylase
MPQVTNSFGIELLKSQDPATVDGLTEAFTRILPALEKFIQFEEPERTAVQRQIWAAQLEEPLLTRGVGPDGVLATLSDVVIPHGLRAGAPGFSGWIATMPTTLPATARLAAALAAPLAVGVQAFNLLEALGARWLAELLGLPASYQGLFTSGGSVANLIGLGAARQYTAEQHGIDPACNGLEGLPKPRIYTSTQVHHCIYPRRGHPRVRAWGGHYAANR